MLEMNNLLILNAGVLGAMPPVLRPLLGPLFNIPLRYKIARVKKFIVPVWEERLKTLEHEPNDPSHEEPGDHMQMMVRYAARERPHELRDFDLITRRVCGSMFGAVHQTTMQVTNLLLNVVGSDAEFNTISTLRDETARIIGGNPDFVWTKSNISHMVKADSVSRETLRLYSFGGRANFRIVMVDGFRTDQGHLLPKGTMISFLGQPAQTDDQLLDDALKFDPFRFSRLREDAASRDEKAPPVSFVSTSPDFLPFGHGKHACPGRFLIDFELKMIQSYIVTNYDLKYPDEYNGRRPPNKWMTEALMPPEGAKILVRRRKS